MRENQQLAFIITSSFQMEKKKGNLFYKNRNGKEKKKSELKNY